MLGRNNTIKTYPLETIQKPSNLTKDELLALKTLSSDKSIVIKEADKGGAVVIMDASYYRNAVLKMLEDEEFYSETDKSMDSQTRKMINKLGTRRLLVWRRSSLPYQFQT